MKAWSELRGSAGSDKDHQRQRELIIRCQEMNKQCNLLCKTVAALLGIGGDHTSILCFACAEICDACALECETCKTDACHLCANECRFCAEECRKMATIFNSPLQQSA